MRHASPRWRTLAASAALALATSLAVAPAAGAQSRPVHPAPGVEVQTYNMDFGGDLSVLFDPSLPLLTATSTVWAQTVSSDIPARAHALAAVIASRDPDLVGLQEVSIWRTAPAAPTATGSVVPTGEFATDYDSLGSLLAALHALGTSYHAVAVDLTFSNEAFPLPALTSTGLRLVTFADYNVILVRDHAVTHGLRVTNAQTHTYQATLPVTVAGQSIAVTRGWAQVDVTLAGRHFRFVDTHLEAFGYPPLKDQVRNPQAQELALRLSQSPYPVVLVGDINSRPTMCADYRPSSPEHALDQNVVAYSTLTGIGLREVWPITHPHNPCGSAGWTSGQSTLDNAASDLTHRIDDVFVSPGVSVVTAKVLGARERDRTPSGLWPSDHASTWAFVRLDGKPWCHQHTR